MSSNYGETFSESHAGMQRTLVTGHTFSPNFGRDGTAYMVTKAGYYQSIDRGRNWQGQSLFADEEVLLTCTAADYAEANTIYVLTKTGVHRGVGGAVRNVDAYSIIRTLQYRLLNGQTSMP
jgi:hypothetical protein